MHNNEFQKCLLRLLCKIKIANTRVSSLDLKAGIKATWTVTNEISFYLFDYIGIKLNKKEE